MEPGEQVFDGRPRTIPRRLIFHVRPLPKYTSLRAMKRMSRSQLSAAYAGLLTFTLGAVLWMVSERPEWRPTPGQGMSTTGRVLASVGQGGAAVGGSILAYRALRFVRRHTLEAAEETPRAYVERGVDLPPRVPLEFRLRLGTTEGRPVETLLRDALTHRSVATTPRPEVRQGADGRVHITAWLETDMAVREVRSDLNTQLHRALREAGIEALPDSDLDARA